MWDCLYGPTVFYNNDAECGPSANAARKVNSVKNQCLLRGSNGDDD